MPRAFGLDLFVVQGIRLGELDDVPTGSMSFVVGLVAIIALLAAFSDRLEETFAR